MKPRCMGMNKKMPADRARMRKYALRPPAIGYLSFIGIAEHIRIFSGMSLHCFQDAQLIALIHAEYVGFADVLWVIVVDLQPVASPFRKHHKSSNAKWRGDMSALADAIALGVFVVKFVDPAIRDRQPVTPGWTYLYSVILIAEGQHSIDWFPLCIGHFHPRERFISRHQMGNDAEDYEEDWEDSFHGSESISDRLGQAFRLT